MSDPERKANKERMLEYLKNKDADEDLTLSLVTMIFVKHTKKNLKQMKTNAVYIRMDLIMMQKILTINVNQRQSTGCLFLCLEDYKASLYTT